METHITVRTMSGATTAARSLTNIKTTLRKRCSSAYRYFQEFSDVTTLHGVRYVAEPGRHPVERLFWGVAIVLCSLWCGVQIEQLWLRWKTSPVIVTLSERSTKIWDIPFPAVTICPENRIRRSRFDIEEQLSKHDVKDRDNTSSPFYFTWQTASMACSRRAKQIFNNTDNFNKVNNSHLKHLFELSFQMEDIFCDCDWGLMESDCDSKFRPILTDSGVCFTFNLLGDAELVNSDVRIVTPANSKWTPRNSTWDPDQGYDRNVDIVDSYPVRALDSGHDSGLAILLRINPDEMQHSCNGDAQSFKLTVHSVAEFPQVKSQFVRLPLDSEVSVAVRPDMITTAKGLRDHKPEIRGCYFPHEKKLNFFKVYTQQNCDMECLMQPIIRSCGCRLYYWPTNASLDIPLCSQEDASCIQRLNARAKTIIAEITEETGTVDPYCSCLPSCSEYKYHLQLSNSQYNISKDFYNEINTSSYNYIRIVIYFKDTQFIHSHRSELYSMLDFLANCGGLLGLFTGFSITSAIEICYFLSMRLACNLREHRQDKRGGD